MCLYVTDYTQNTALYSYKWSSKSAKSDWKGPFGKYTLSIECWDGMSEQANKCQVGGYYIFRNVRGKR
jgi:hypothetical protein